jgi:hypothetical protein
MLCFHSTGLILLSMTWSSSNPVAAKPAGFKLAAEVAA